MITALIRADAGIDALAATLTALVTGVADGIVADAVVMARRDDDEVARVADALGARFVVLKSGEDPWARGAALTKREWVLCLDAGDVPSGSWILAIEGFLVTSGRSRHRGRLRRRAHGAGEALLLAWRALTGHRVLSGDVVRRSILVQGRRPGRPARLRAHIERSPALA